LSYFESRLRVNFEDIKEVYRVLKFCEKLKLYNLILEPLNNSKNFRDEIFRKIKENSKFNIFYRLSLNPRNLNKFKNELRHYNKFPYIISLDSQEKEIQIQAAKDSRIDVLSYSDPVNMKTATSGVISLAKQNGTFIEFSLAPIMEKNKALQSKNLRLIYRFIQLILRIKPKLIISGNFDTIYNLRHPRNLCSVCHTLLGLPLDNAKMAFSKNVEMLLQKVSARKDNKFIHPGVRLIKGENTYER
jgi:RNase P/RNase MRP subunit p30